MVTYREYKDEDWKAICQIHDRARPDELRGSCDPRGFIPIEQDKEAKELKASWKYVACEDETVVGFVGVDDKYLAWLYIDPAHYGKGLGRELLRIGLREIGDGAWTIVLDRNATAFRLSKAKAFERRNAFPVKITGTRSLV